MTIRPARDEDWQRVGELCEALVSAHYAWDMSRFIPVDKLRGDVYTARVREHIGDTKTRKHETAKETAPAGTVFVADVGGRVAGYVFAGIEPENWKELRHEAGYVHDLVVDPALRRGGIGAALLQAALDWFDARGVTRVMLWTAPQNAGAQQLFTRLGFRPTMIEMTRDR